LNAILFRRQLGLALRLVLALALSGYFFYWASPGWNDGIDWKAVIFEGLLFLFVFFWTLAVLPQWKSARTLCLGSVLFLIGSFADVYDNFLIQPRWENWLVENLSLALGGGLMALGIRFWAREKERLLDEIQRERDFEASLIPKLSHDLRVPLSNLIGMTSIVEEDPQLFGDSVKRREYLDLIMRGAKEMNLLIDNILESHRMKSGTVALHPSAFSLAPLLDAALEDFHYQAKKKEIRLVKDFPDGEIPLVADRIKVVRIIQNLLANAVKFSPKGGKITLKARAENSAIAIRVMDEGPGVPAEQATARSDESPAAARKGSEGASESFGIGLKVVREFVRLHGGRFWIEPNVPKGAQFCFTLPLRQGKA